VFYDRYAHVYILIASYRLAVVSTATARQCLKQLAEAVPVLRQLCIRLDKNFFHYLRLPGCIKDLPADCLQGLKVEKSSRWRHTMAYLLAAPGEREELGGIKMSIEGQETVHMEDEIQSEKTTTTGEIQESAGRYSDYRRFIE
jgi:hypothetical protein